MGCAGFVFAENATTPRGGTCVNGESCCYLKKGAKSLVPSDAMTAVSVAGREARACGIHLASSKDLNGPWEITYDIAYGTEGHWDNCSLTNPGPFIYPNGTALMMFKLCRYPPNCPNGRYIMGLLSGETWDSPYTMRPRATPIWNSTGSVEDPSNGWMDRRGHLHMVVHQGLNRGMSIHSTDGIDWMYDQSLDAYSPELTFTDGTTLVVDNRQEPKVIIDDATGLPSHLLTICGIGGTKHTFVCVQPIRKQAVV